MADKTGNLIDPEDIQPIFKFIGKNWHFLIIFPMVALVIAYLYNGRQHNIYAAKAEILLKSSETYDYQKQIYSSLGYYTLLQDITNQKRVISSYDMTSKTLKTLDFNISYLLEGRWAAKYVHEFLFLEVDVQRMEPQLMRSPFTIRIIDPDTYGLSYVLYGNLHEKEYKFGQVIEDVHYDLIIDRHERFTDEKFDSQKDRIWQFVVNPHSQLVNKYRGGLAIKNVEYTSILTLQVRDEVAERAKMFLDSLSKVYIDYTLESQIQVNKNTEEHIEKQLLELEEIISSLEFELERFKENNNILDLDKESSEYFQSMVEFEGEKRQLELRHESIEALEEFMYTGFDETALPPSFYVFDEDDLLRSQVKQLFDLKVSRSQKLIQFTEEHIEIYRVDSLISTVRIGILRYTVDTKAAVQRKIIDIEKQINHFEKLLQGIPKSQRDILGIDRKLKVNESLYIFLLEKKANTVIARAAIISQTSIIESARSLGVVGPDKTKTLYVSGGIGFTLALVFGFARLIFYERIENMRELKNITKLPVLGSVPNYAEVDIDPIAIVSHPRANVSEALRTIRTNLQYMLDEKGNKVILVTSLHPGEGKTFFSANLAAVLAKAGKRVLILDFDMHRPKMHKTFGLENVTGVSTYLISKADLTSTIVPTQIENLDVMLAGPVPPNASELLLSPRVSLLLESVRTQYEYIIIDTPPLMLISDSLVLLEHCNTGVFVMNTNKATKQGVRYLQEVLSKTSPSNNSLLLNNVKQKRWKYYYGKYAYRYGYGYSYGYDYGYGYGYGYGDESEEGSKRKKRNGKS